MKKEVKNPLIKELLEIVWGFVKSRIFILTLICFGLFSILIYRVFNLQIVNSEKYASEYNQKSERTRFYRGTRGNIYDADGNLLAYNKPTYAVTLEDTIDSSSKKNAQLNDIVHTTIGLIEKNGDSIISDFALVIDDAGGISFNESYSETSRIRFLKNIYGEDLDTEDVRHSEESARTTFEYLRDERYKVTDESYTDEEVLKIIMIRYNLSLNSYQKYISTNIANNVSENTVVAIYENAAKIPGVKIEEDTVRVYNNSAYFAHILGYTGKTSEDEMVALNDQISDDTIPYQLNDIVGKSGVEATYETFLAGAKGYDKVIADNTGKVLSVDEYVEQGSGDDVYLTIKSDLQIGIYHIIEEHLAGILMDKIVNHELSKKDIEEWYISIKSVYFQMINNNVVDLSHFNNEKATENEKNVYAAMDASRTQVISNIENELYNDDSAALSYLTEELNAYYTFIFNRLVLDGVIQKDNIPDSDAVYASWMRDSISLRTILKYLVANNLLDTSLLPITGEYLSSEEIYEALVIYIKDLLENDKAFTKLIYKYLINYGTISGSQVCMLLFDQGVLEFDEQIYNGLRNGMYSPYNFMMDQIESLKITPAQIALTPCSASCTIVDPDTGNVLAMVSYPSYDNNIFSGYIDSVYWQQLSEDLSSPLYSRATKMRTAPGSTFKMCSAITGLEEGVVDTYSTISCTGLYETVQPSPRCWIFPGSHGAITISRAIEVSCNYFFYEVGYRVSSKLYGAFNEKSGLDKLKIYGEMLGLTSRSGVEIEEYAPLFTDKNVIASFIGQGTNSFTGVQLARYVNTIAADGLNSELTLISSVKDANGDTLPKIEKNQTQIDVLPSTITTVKKGMERAGDSYSAFRNLSFSVAAKTGTAQENSNYPDHALCIGFAPAQDPEISFSVNIQYGYKSSYAVSLSSDVLKYYFGEITLDQVMDGDANGPKVDGGGSASVGAAVEDAQN